MKTNEIQLTQFEKELLARIPDEFKYLARDGNGELYFYEKKPNKHDGRIYTNIKKDKETWGGGENYYWLNLIAVFDFIKWEDEEPWNFREMIK